MDVRCSNCQTEYEFDESRIPANGASVKCSNCYHVFRIEKQAPTVQSVRPAPAQTQNQEPAAQPWIVRGQDGSTITCNGLSDIQHMIKANRLTRDDYLQKPGQDWIALGDVPELVSIFNMFSVPEAAPTQAPFPISPQSAAPNQATQLFIKQADFSSPIKETETHPKTLDTPWPQIEPSPHQSQPEIPAAQPQVTRPEMATPQPPAPQFQAQPQAPLSQPEMPAAPAAGVPLEQLMNQQLSPTREEIPQAISSTNGSASLPQPPAPQFQAQPQAPLSQPKMPAAPAAGVPLEQLMNQQTIPGVTAQPAQGGGTPLAELDQGGENVPVKVTQVTPEKTDSSDRYQQWQKNAPEKEPPAPQQSSWSHIDSFSVDAHEDEQDFELPRTGMGKGKKIALVIILLILVAIAAVLGYQLFGSVPKEAIEKYKHGIKITFKGTPDKYQDALTTFDHVLKVANNYHQANIGKASVFMYWSDYLKTQSRLYMDSYRDLQYQLKELDKDEKADSTLKEELNIQGKQMAAQIDDLREQAANKLRQGFDIIQKLTNTSDNLPPLVKLAVADYYRQVNETEKFKKFLSEAKAEIRFDQLAVPAMEAEIKYLMAGFDLENLSAGNKKGYARVKNLVKESLVYNNSLLKARFLLAYIFAKMDKPGKAKEQLRIILQENEFYKPALLLKNNLSQKQKKEVKKEAKTVVAKVKKAKTVKKARPKAQSMFSPPAKAPKRTKKTKRKFGGKAGQNYNFFLKKADRLRDNESYSKAIKNYKKAAELAPRKGQPFVGMGWCAIDNGDIKKAIDYFHKAIFRESRLAEAYIGLGEGYKELGNTKKAKSYFKKYLQVAPKGPEANVAKTNLRKLK